MGFKLKIKCVILLELANNPLGLIKCFFYLPYAYHFIKDLKSLPKWLHGKPLFGSIVLCCGSQVERHSLVTLTIHVS